jgi:Cu+-exporting ATPase
MTEQGVKIGQDVEGYMQGHEKAGRTCVVISVNSRPLACIAVADPLKPEAKGVVAALHHQVWG